MGKTGRGIGEHMPGQLVPEWRDTYTDRTAAGARAWLAKRMPELAKRPLARQRVCLYDNTADDHFILEKGDGVVVGAGFSGHGFKFGPVIGEELASMAL